MQKGKLYGIGIGPGDPELITLKAIKALQAADVVYVPKSSEQASTALSIVKDHLSESAHVEHLEFPMSRDVKVRERSRKQNAITIATVLNDGKNAAFITLGDPMLYSTYSYVLEYLDEGYDIETIPGIYSFSAISNMLNLPLCKGNESVAVICAFTEKDKAIFDYVDTVVCMKVSAYNSELYRFLADNEKYKFTMITDVGKVSQKVFSNKDVLQTDVPYFSTAIVSKK